MAFLNTEWKKKVGVNRPPLSERMAYLKHIVDYEPNLAPLVQHDWLNVHGRDEQLPYYFSEDWTQYIYCGGRGLGKTRTANEWQRYLIFEKHKDSAIRIGVICPTNADVDKVMIMGESGLWNIMSESERSKATYNINAARIIFENGSVIYYYSAENAERLRGNQWHYCELDELAAYAPDKIPEILMQVTMCLRLRPPLYKDKKTGELVQGRAQKMITTTPKAQPWLRTLFRDALTDDTIIIAQGSTYDNQANLDETLFKDITKYEGTALGDQEIHGKLLLENENGIIKREWLKLYPFDKKLPKLKYVFGSYDPAATAKKENHPSAMVMFGVFTDEDSENSIIILDAWEHWFEYPDLRAQILIDWDKKYGDQPTNRKKPGAMIIEAKSNGLAVARDIYRIGVKVIEVSPGPGDDKWSRLNSVSHLVKDGRLYFPESRVNPGNVHKAFKNLWDQLCDFPEVEHDDLTDCVSQALNLFATGSLLQGQMTDRDYDPDASDVDEDHPFYEKTKNPYLV